MNHQALALFMIFTMKISYRPIYFQWVFPFNISHFHFERANNMQQIQGTISK